MPLTVLDFTDTIGCRLQFLLFALQYLRAGLTVPKYFEHAEKEASNLLEKAEKIQKKSRRIVAVITCIQAGLLLLECLFILILWLYTTDDT